MYVAGHLFELRKECDARGGQVCLREKNGKTICQFFVFSRAPCEPNFSKDSSNLLIFLFVLWFSIFATPIESEKIQGELGIESMFRPCCWRSLAFETISLGFIGVMHGQIHIIYIHVFIQKETTATRKNMEKLPWLGIASLGASFGWLGSHVFCWMLRWVWKWAEVWSKHEWNACN